jgi:DNA-binding transcriptional regulator GbsR (MarR family)
MSKIKMNTIRKDLLEIEKAQEQIRKAYAKIQTIQEKNDYLRNLDSDDTSHLTENEAIELFEIKDKIMKANDERNIFN